MQTRHRLTPFAAILAVSALFGCSNSTEAVAAAAPTVAAADFSAAFSNPLMPLVPGTMYVSKGQTDEGIEVDSFFVTHETEVIDGVRTTVVSDRAYVNGSLHEQTTDWFATDDKGNVWYFGEDTKQIQEGKVIGTEGTWQSGQNEARAGIVMEAAPKVGDVYQQEHAKGVAEDMAKVIATNVTVTVPYGSFTHCLQTAEWTPLKPGIVDYKYSCPGVGFVKNQQVRGGTETLYLVSVFTR